MYARALIEYLSVHLKESGATETIRNEALQKARGEHSPDALEQDPSGALAQQPPTAKVAADELQAERVSPLPSLNEAVQA